MSSATPQFSEIKARMNAMWNSGDFGQIANYNRPIAEEFVSRMTIRPGMKVLDVACGTGNTAVPLARAGAAVTGLDIAPRLLQQARARAAAENLEIEFLEGDAEELPFGEQEFDLVLSMFGAMFAPRPERVAAEFVRVCKPGGQIAMANWTPEGFIGQSFQKTAMFVPPPPGIVPPVLWGKEDAVRQRFSSGIASLQATRRTAVMDFPYRPTELVGFFREHLGPNKAAFAQLDETGQAQLAAEMEKHWTQYNLSKDGRTQIEAEYLEVRAVRA